MRPLLSAALLTSALVLCSPSHAEDISSLLDRLTQTFSDASQVFQCNSRGKVTGFVYLRGSHSLTFTRKAA